MYCIFVSYFFFQCDIFEIVLELRKQRYGMIQVKVSLTPILLMYMYIWKKNGWCLLPIYVVFTQFKWIITT